MPWSGLRQRTAAVSAQSARNRGSPRRGRPSWSASRCGGVRAARRRRRAGAGSTRRCRPAPAGCPASRRRCGELALGQVVLAADAEHDLQRPRRGPMPPAPAVVMKSKKSLGLVRAGRDPQRLDGEAGVADPGVAVVPVALAADVLGQRRRRRGDDRAGRLVGQALQDPAAVVHEVPPRALVGLVQVGPRLPGRERAVEQLGRARPAARLRGDGVAQRAALQREVHDVPGPRGAAAPRARPSLTARRPGSVSTSQSAPPRAATPPSTCDEQRHDQPVLGPRAGSRRATSTSPAVQVSRRTSTCGTSVPSRCPPLSGPSPSGVGEHQLAVGGAERGLQHQRPARRSGGSPSIRRPARPASGRRRRPAGGRRPRVRRSGGSTSHSTEPARSTRAHECRSERRAWSAMGVELIGLLSSRSCLSVGPTGQVRSASDAESMRSLRRPGGLESRVQRQPAVDEQRLAGDVGGLVGAQERGDRGHLLRVARRGASGCGSRPSPLDRVVDPRPVDRGDGRTRADAVDPDAARRRTPAPACGSGSASRPWTPSSRGTAASGSPGARSRR